MSRNRTIPFGYMMINGEIVPESAESKAVQDIFKMYLDGNSLLTIANAMSQKGISYNGNSLKWNKNMVKRIIENEKYIGADGYPQIIDEDTFIKANKQKKSKSTSFCEKSEDIQEIHKVIFCKECGRRLYRTNGEIWDCGNPECSRLGYILTDNMLFGVIINVLNMAISNPKLLDTDSKISSYIPSIDVTRQQNEVNRLMDDPNTDFDKVKEEIFRLAELKYNCCTYNDKPQKTAQLKAVIADCEQINRLDIGLLKTCISRIWVSHFYTIEVEFTNGVTIKNTTERTDKNESGTKSNHNSGESADV